MNAREFIDKYKGRIIRIEDLTAEGGIQQVVYWVVFPNATCIIQDFAADGFTVFVECPNNLNDLDALLANGLKI